MALDVFQQLRAQGAQLTAATVSLGNREERSGQMKQRAEAYFFSKVNIRLSLYFLTFFGVTVKESS